MLLAPHSPAAAAIDCEPEYASNAASQDARQHVDWQGTVVIHSLNREDSFAIGPDGCVWNFVRQHGAAPLLLPTGLKANSFAVARDSEGQLVLFAAQGLQLHASIQQPEAEDLHTHWDPRACSQWSKPVALNLPQVPHAQSIVRVSCEGRGAHLHVGVLLQCHRPQMADHFEMAVSHWPKNGQQFQHFRSAGRAWVNAWQELLVDLRHMAEATQLGLPMTRS
jgi:hypothetical protein